jgi:uncharacterized protein
MTGMLAAAVPSPACQIGALEAVPHHTGALWLPSERTLLISDLHLEKASCYAGRGVFLPPYDTRATLAEAALAVLAFQPRRIIAMGDSFHDRHGSARLEAVDREVLCGLQTGRDWLWLTGNHDPEAAGNLPGDVADVVYLSGVRLVHEPTLDAGPEIAGHLHPAAKVRLRGKSVRRRCFIGDGTKLVMPAMGALAGGLNVRDGAVQRLFQHGADVWMLGDGRVFNVSRTMLLPD